MKIQDFKIKVTPEQSRIVQETIFSDKYDCEWNSYTEGKSISHTSRPYLYLENGKLLFGNIYENFLEANTKVITFEQFKQKYIDEEFVLPKKWCVRPRCPEEVEIVKQCDLITQYGDAISSRFYSHYPAFDKRITTWSSDLKINSGYTEITFEQFKKHVLKQDDMKEDKKIIGYKWKSGFQKYQSAAEKIADVCDLHIEVYGCNFNKNSITHDLLEKAGVIDRWFDPVYEEEEKMPVINGYEGEFLEESNQVKYGCKTIFVKTLNELLLLGVSTIMIDEHEITRRDIKEIIKYINTTK